MAELKAQFDYVRNELEVMTHNIMVPTFDMSDFKMTENNNEKTKRILTVYEKDSIKVCIMKTDDNEITKYIIITTPRYVGKTVITKETEDKYFIESSIKKLGTKIKKRVNERGTYEERDEICFNQIELATLQTMGYDGSKKGHWITYEDEE